MATERVEQPFLAGSEEPRMTLAARMKQYEAATEINLEPSQPVILRLDGHAFSKFTAPFSKPFDERLHKAMVRTCADLLDCYPAATLAYTQSDEITLIFPNGVESFNDRAMKIVTLAAGFCSVHFYSHLITALAESPDPPLKKDIRSLPLPYFDGRIFNVPTVEECLNNVLWRCRGDAVRNSVSAFARSFFSTRELHGKNQEEMVEMVRREKGVVYREAVPRWALEGSIVKKTLVELEAVNKKTGERALSTRTRTRCEDRGITEFSDATLALVKEKYWP
jgi:tRNA(His) 5'-end guanylyltransferase